MQTMTFRKIITTIILHFDNNNNKMRKNKDLYFLYKI